MEGLPVSCWRTGYVDFGRRRRPGRGHTVFFCTGSADARLVGADIAHAVPLTAVAGLGHLHMGTVDFVLLGSLLLGSLPGIFLGSRLSPRVPENIMRPILASMLIWIGVKFVW